MRHSVSSIGFDWASRSQSLPALRQLGITGLELAPTMLWPAWQNVNAASIAQAKQELSDLGFEVPALQAVLFGLPHLQMFPAVNSSALVEHFKLVGEIAEGLGAQVLVFGSPKNRKRGQLSYFRAYSQALDVFGCIGDILATHGVVLGLEANPVEYQCDFMTCTADVSDVVTKLAHSAVGVHFDTGGVFMSGASLKQELQQLNGNQVHYHVSAPYLEPLLNQQKEHVEAAQFLLSGSYRDGWVSLEMKRPEVAELWEQSVQNFVSWYA